MPGTGFPFHLDLLRTIIFYARISCLRTIQEERSDKLICLFSYLSTLLLEFYLCSNDMSATTLQWSEAVTLYFEDTVLVVREDV